VIPAPIIPIPGSLWAIAVLMTGSTPVCSTLRTSMPVAMPRKSSSGIVTFGFVVVVISAMPSENATASSTVPPTSATIAGADAIAKPPSP